MVRDIYKALHVSSEHLSNGKRYQSNVQWPEGQYPFGNDVSTDKHDSYEAAQAVCKALEREGWGCEGKIFPVKTWVSEVPKQK